MRTVLNRLWMMRWSLAGFVAALAIAFLSLGYSSLLLYAVAAPMLGVVYPPLAQWHGPWVWPVLVGVAILWSPSFLVAGVLGQALEARAWSIGRRRMAYLAVLWLGAVLAWFAVLHANFPPGGRG